ncbi:GNAT family N-acetyltransferase [Paractinoplanes ferrugineus]|uniref:N-acetyltransferase domain-containing protein n=1 Tax=Paractinoplanes ferrugineus TaxID=113564 RepID=A0A919J9C3_9ACTN|nr:GNAT family N-acetyltransferase [Actinoplanes ferrugineus]GIE15657.1 hypothetical protein Afe05nite_74970 [Actinoplanes ferrugineus]
MIAIRPVSAAQLCDLQDRLEPVYRQCFSAPPWNETDEEIADYPARLARHTGHPGSYGFVAEEGAELAGAIYGWPAPACLPEASAFDLAVRDAVSPAVAALLVAPAVVVAELMVAPAFHRRGIGRTLLAEYVAGRSRAWLATHPGAGAVALYESEGWVRRAAYVASGTPLVLYTYQASPPRDTPALPAPGQGSACGPVRRRSATRPNRRPPSRPV